MKDKLLSREKKQTFRTTFIPTYDFGEIVHIKYKKEIIFDAKITNIYPKQIRDITLEEAQRDGFDSIKEFQKKIMELNKIKSLNHWGFIIQFYKLDYFVF